MQSWYVFTCSPNKERLAASRLGERGHLANVPCLPRAIRKGPARKRQPVPAIPGYVLIYMDEPSPRSLRQILSLEFTNGAVCVHRMIPGKVSAEEMREFLQYLEASKERFAVKQSVKPGDKVRVHYGPMEGKIGEVESVKGAKVNLLIELFKVCVKADQVELAAQPEKNDARGGISLHKSANQITRPGRDGGRSATGGKSRIDRQSQRATMG